MPLLEQYPTLEDHQKSRLLSLSIDFMQLMYELESPDAAMAIWNSISDTIHPELKNDILVMMLKGQTSLDLRFSNADVNFIGCIKVLRQYTGLGLKEAKDLADLGRGQNVASVRLNSWTQRKNCADDLRELGVRIC